MHYIFFFFWAAFLVYWIVVNIIVPLVVNVVLPIASIGLVILLSSAFCYTLFFVSRDLWQAFVKVYRKRIAAPSDLYEGEARTGYLFAPAAREDISEFFISGMQAAIGRVRNAASKYNAAGEWYENLFYAVNWIFAASFGIFTSLAVAALLGILGFIAALFLTAFFVTLLLLDLGYMSLRRLIAHCPECHHKSFHLHYDCPACPGRPQRHRHLRPNRAGALWHICVCGARVPAHILTGRGHKMVAYCALKGHPINSELIGAAAVHVALAGGPDSGKSTVLVGLLRHWFRHPDFRNLKIRLEDPIQRRQIEGWINDLDRGICPPKTNRERHRATTLLYDEPGSKQRALYVFDTSGEMFSSSQLAASHTYFDSSDYIIFMLDPLSLAPFRTEVVRMLGASAISEASPSETRPLAVASSLLELLDAHGAKRHSNRFITKLAVVLTKSDMVMDRNTLRSSAEIRTFIDLYGGRELLRLLEANFEYIKITHISGIAAKGKSAVDSFEWLAKDIMTHAREKSAEKLAIRLRRA